MAFIFTRLVRYSLFAYILYALFTTAIDSKKNFNFSANNFRSAAERAKGPGKLAVDKFVVDLRRSSGPYVATTLDWFRVTAGGLNLKAEIIHTSLFEFIVAFNAPLGTSGRSGLHFANITCTVLSGKVERVLDSPQTDSVETFVAGSNFRQSSFSSPVYSLAPSTYLVCYGRGFTPLSAFWLAPQAILSADPEALARLLYYSGLSFFHSTVHTLGTYKKQLLG